MAYFIQVKIAPTDQNDSKSLVNSAYAVCVSNAKSEIGAIFHARFHIEKYHWLFGEITEGPVLVDESNFAGRDIGLELYNSSIKTGFSFHIIGVATDGKEHPPRQIELIDNVPISQLLEIENRARAHGECLHFDAGEKCTNIIHAHSIQKNSTLSAICDESNHVLMRYSDAARIRKANGNIPFRKIGIKEASVFRGFCGYHDNQLFEPIDNAPFCPDPLLATLVAYRSICKEICSKKYMINVGEQYAELHRSNNAMHNLFKSHVIGGKIGLAMLNQHKIEFDSMLKTENYQDIRCTMFSMAGKPFFACSSSIFPDFGFSGETIQNRKDSLTCHGLLSCNTVTTTDGWALLFIWHATSDLACIPFINSMKNVFRERKYSISNYILHFLFSSFENLAISPVWFNPLNKSEQEALNRILTETADPLNPLNSDYLKKPACEFIDLDITGVADFPNET